ncbi:MAG: glycosyl hydrolase [Solirubrobacterales bacterium]
MLCLLVLGPVHEPDGAQTRLAQVRPVRRRTTLSPIRLLAALGWALLGLGSAAACAVAAPPAAPSAGFYGVTSATKLSVAEYERMSAGGVATLRVPFYWPHIESERPSEPPAPLPNVPGPLPVDGEDASRFSATDEIVERAAREGIRVSPFVYGTPPWVASDPGRPPIDDDAARAAYQDFLVDLVGRYGPAGAFWRERAITDPGLPFVPITDWQVWNEPNSPVFWAPKPSPSEYAKVVALAAEAIRAVDPAATVALAGMFGTPSNGIDAWRFLDRFHAAGVAASSFDAYALHPYAPKLDGITTQAKRMQRAIAAGPAPNAPLWITEIGWPTDGPPGFALVKSEQGQKRLLARSYRLFLSNREQWNIARVVWFVWRDNEIQADCTVCRFSGLFSDRLEPKPAWRKLTEFTGGRP